MKKPSIFGPVWLLGVSGTAVGIYHSSLNFFQKKDLIKEFKSLKEEAKKSFEKIKNQIKNKKLVLDFKDFLYCFMKIAQIQNLDLTVNYEASKYFRKHIKFLKEKIEQENQDKNEIKNIFKDIEFFALLTRNMHEKMNKWFHKEKEFERKMNEISRKLNLKEKDYKKDLGYEKLKSLINYVRVEILNKQYLLDENIDNLENFFLIQEKEFEKKMKALISENEKFKDIKEDLDAFLNLALNLKKSSFLSSFFDEFLLDEVNSKFLNT